MQLVMNRYTTADNNLQGTMPNYTHIIYQNNCKKNPENTNSNEMSGQMNIN